MKRFTLLTATLVNGLLGLAQWQFNPQIGLTFQNLTDAPENAEYKAKAGWILGMDARVGETFYLQPGLFFARNATTVTTEVPSNDPNNQGTITTNSIEDDIVRSYAKLRLMGGWKLINGDGFKLRLAVGPSYDFLLSVDDKDDKLGFEEADFTSGSFNLDAAVGMDIAFFTVEPGVSFGLSQVYSDNIRTQEIDSKYLTFSLTVGLVFGSGR
jgi:hypothetical protein